MSSHSIFLADDCEALFPPMSCSFIKPRENATVNAMPLITLCVTIAWQLKQIGLWKVHFAANTGHPRTQKTDATPKFSVCALVHHQEGPPAFFRDKELPCRDNLKTVNYLPTWNLSIDVSFCLSAHVCINAGPVGMQLNRCELLNKDKVNAVRYHLITSSLVWNFTNWHIGCLQGRWNSLRLKITNSSSGLDLCHYTFKRQK